MVKKRSPICWFGGKGGMTAKLIDLLPSHHIYVEAFGGGGNLLFAKDPAPVEVYNDLNSGLVNFFNVLRDEHRVQRLVYLLTMTPNSREFYYQCKETWQDHEDPVEKAYRWFVVARLSFGGMFGASWGHTKTTSTRGMGSRNSAWISAQQLIGECHSRFMRVQVEQQDFRILIPRYDTPQTLFYLDPPYVPATRKEGKYEHEMTEEDHAVLVEIMLGLEGMVMLSGYRHDVYKPLEKAGWKRKDFPVFCRVYGRTAAAKRTHGEALGDKLKRVECVWLSPNAQANARGKRSSKPKAKAAARIHAYPAGELAAA